MHVNYRLFFGAMWQTLISRPLRPGNLLRVMAWTVVFLGFEWLTWIFLQLDRLFYPGFRKTPIGSPVFILGTPRSGTTFFFRLMALDDRLFHPFRLFEIMFPAINQRRLLACVARFDRALGSPLRRVLARLERWIMEPADKIRRVRFGEPEEDDLLLVHKFASAVLLMVFPDAAVLAPHGHLNPAVYSKLRDLLCVQGLRLVRRNRRPIPHVLSELRSHTKEEIAFAGQRVFEELGGNCSAISIALGSPATLSSAADAP